MNRRSEIGMWGALVALAALAGIAIAGVPSFGSGADTVAVNTPPANETVTPGPDAESDLEANLTTTTTNPTTTTSTTTTTTAPAPPELRANTEVTVLVVNGTRVPGAAGRLSDGLADEGHPTLTPTSTRPFDNSEVWFTSDFGPEAADLAERLGIFPENVMVMPEDAGITVGSAQVIVVVGPDLADQT